MTSYNYWEFEIMYIVKGRKKRKFSLLLRNFIDYLDGKSINMKIGAEVPSLYCLKFVLFEVSKHHQDQDNQAYKICSTKKMKRSS